MSTLASSIGTILYNLELQANSVLLRITDAKNAALSSIGTTSLDKPTIKDAPSWALTEPTEIYTALSSVKTSLDVLRNSLPDLNTLLSQINGSNSAQQLISSFETLNNTRRAAIRSAYNDIPLPAIRSSGADTEPYFTTFKDNSGREWRVSSFVDDALGQHSAFVSKLDPGLPVPAFAKAAFETQAAARTTLERTYARNLAKFEEDIINERAAIKINEMALDKQGLMVEASLEYALRCMGPLVKIYALGYPKAEVIEEFYRDLSSARTNLMDAIGGNVVADIKTRLAYTGAVKEYYDLFEKVERLRLSVDSLELQLDSDDYALRARQVASSASASASAAAAGFSAIRVGYTLSEKAFT